MLLFTGVCQLFERPLDVPVLGTRPLRLKEAAPSLCREIKLKSSLFKFEPRLLGLALLVSPAWTLFNNARVLERLVTLATHGALLLDDRVV